MLGEGYSDSLHLIVGVGCDERHALNQTSKQLVANHSLTRVQHMHLHGLQEGEQSLKLQTWGSLMVQT